MNLIARSPQVALAFSVLAIIACGCLWWRYLAEPSGPNVKWGFDVETGIIFPIAITAIPPYAAPSGRENGVDALNVEDSEGLRRAHALRMYRPEAAAVIRQMVETNGSLDDPRKMMETVNRGKLIRRVTDREWVSEMSAAGQAILRETPTSAVTP